jgi:putative glycosyltransferase (TIGR04372 family)
MHGRKPLDLFYHSSVICNYQLKEMWDRTLRISRFAGRVDQLNRWLPGGGKHEIPDTENRRNSFYAPLASSAPRLVFNEAEERQGYAALQGLGVPAEVPFICFHAREPGYLDGTVPKLDLDAWRYHDYRNSSIHNYVPAAEKMTDRGYFAIRTGALVEESLETNAPMIIDYAANHRTDFLDIYLGAKCRFFICDTAGFWAVPAVFGRPIAWVNSIPLELVHTWNPSHITIPKKLWLVNDRRFMTFREIVDSGAGMFMVTQKYSEAGLEAVENTPEEISALAIEMDERLKGTWQATEEDEELQQRFWSILEPSVSGRVIRSRIGAEFLRQNRDLLD